MVHDKLANRVVAIVLDGSSRDLDILLGYGGLPYIVHVRIFVLLSVGFYRFTIRGAIFESLSE